MPESIVQVTEGVGKKLHTWQKTIGANVVEDEVIVVGDQYLPSYFTSTGVGIAAGTAASHLIQIMAGASLRVYLRRLMVYQVAMATAASTHDFILTRLTTAGTGGGVLGVATMDPADVAAGATAMSLPTTKGTEGASGGWRGQVYFNQTLPTALATPYGMLILDLDFDKLRVKPPIIAAGAANGLALKNATAIAGATVTVVAYLTEASF